jgi:predicted RNA-binding Zn-ribbon protein involved in translation (DUF1610 family)
VSRLWKCILFKTSKEASKEFPYITSSRWGMHSMQDNTVKCPQCGNETIDACHYPCPNCGYVKECGL